MDPLTKFVELLERARTTPGIFDATAMTLATVGDDGRPSARIVLLKSAGPEGLIFYTNHQSRKGRQIIAHPDVALVFWWPQLESQVRFEGRALQARSDDADAYFATRARISQLGAWASEQSQPLASRQELEERFAQLEKKYEGKTIPRPPHWGGFRVVPVSVEFWWNRPGRLHERELYTRPQPGAPWTKTLLNP